MKIVRFYVWKEAVHEKEARKLLRWLYPNKSAI